VERYRTAKNGVEEFAYIGEEILADGCNSDNFSKTNQWSEADWLSKRLRLLEVSPEIVTLYRGLFNPHLTR